MRGPNHPGLREIIVTPHETVLSISGGGDDGSPDDNLFQLPRTDSFLRALTKMAFHSDRILRDTLAEMDKVARFRQIRGVQNT
jgi:hypothetical protein